LQFSLGAGAANFSSSGQARATPQRSTIPRRDFIVVVVGFFVVVWIVFIVVVVVVTIVDALSFSL
jgi:hypothetical protein